MKSKRVRFAPRPMDRSRIAPVYPEPMGEVKARVRLENASDRFLQRSGIQGEVRAYESDAVVDSGAVMLAIPQDAADVLGLHETGRVVVAPADESKLELPKVGPIDVTVSGRTMTCEAVALPPEAEVLIGQVVLETLDLLVDCQNQTLIPRPESPNYPSLKLK